MSKTWAYATSLLFLMVGPGLAACGDGAPPAKTPAPVASASAAAPLTEEDKPLPLDKRITHGKLPNGLTYYILPHHKPEKRAQIWLAVNAGSVLEDDDQRGLAHFVEHMGFNGTKRFPKSSIIDFVEKSGIRFGADLNAYTSFDETVYTLQVPTDKPELVNKGFEILRDWAGDVTFEPEEVEKERGVVLEEWRLGRGAGMRLFDKTAPIVFYGSKYADRITIGKPEIIKKAPRDTVMRFYKDWYRPDLMAVIAVGDFTAADVEAKIKSEFSSLPAPAKNARPRTTVPMPAHEKTMVAIESDPEATTTSVSYVTKMPHRPEKSARDYRREVAERLFNSMLNQRFDEIRRQPNAPFLGAFSSTGAMVRPADSFTQGATVKEDGVQAGFEALMEEVLRVERHGFTTGELDRAKANLLRSYQQTVKEYDKRDSRGYAQELVRNFLVDELAPGPEAELAMVEKFLPTYTLAELNQIGKSLGGGSHVIRVTGPSTMVKPTAEAMLATNKAVAAREIKPYEDSAGNVALLDKPPTPGPVTKTTVISEIGVTEWTLKNGVKVVVKPTTFANDEVRIAGFSPGGTSLIKDADYETARFADTVVALGGLGSLDAVKLRKSLAGKYASVSPFIHELQEGVNANGSPQDLETIFQLLYLTFTAPRKDEPAFQAWKTRELESVKNRRLSPEVTFSEDLVTFETNNHLRRRPTTTEAVNKINLDKAMDIYKERFGDAGDFTFVIVGNVEESKLKPLVETYLGSLPSKGRKETWKDVHVTWPEGTPTKTVVKGSEPKSSVVMTYHGTEKWTRDNANDMRMLGEVLGMRLREILREDMGGTYGVSSGGSIMRRPHPEYSFTVRFGCAPENVDRLEKAVFDEVKNVQEKGVGDDYINKIKAQRTRSYETALKENSYWLTQLENSYQYGDDPKLILDQKAMIDKVSSDRVKAAAKKYLTNKTYVIGVLKPETGSK
jgi:zinc protease